MAQHEIDTMWMGKMQFNSLVNGHTIVMDTPERGGGEDQGPTPKPFILTALSGCTGMDVVAILRKEKKEAKEFSMRVIGELSRHAPLEYVAMHIIFDFKGQNENSEAAVNAVNISQEKYCGVSSMLKKALPITWEIHYNNTLVYNNKPETITA
jgi:putative redox protein